MSCSILAMAMSVALEATYPTTETWLTTLGTARTVLETERAQTSWMATAMTTMTRWSLDAEFVEEAVDADIAEADAKDEEAVDMDEAGDMGEEFDLVRVVQKMAKWFGKGLIVDAHVVACEDDDKDGGEETDLCTVRAGPVEQPLTWDDEDVAAPERFFCL